MNTLRLRLISGLFVLLAMSAAAWWMVMSPTALQGPRSDDGRRATFPWQRQAAIDLPADAQAALGDRDVAALRERVFIQGALAGLDVSGQWCPVVADALVPCAELRTRFEHYLLALRQVDVSAVRLLMVDDARRELGDRAAQQIGEVFDRYWQLRSHDWRITLVVRELDTWIPALEERHRVRVQILGQDWAKAFFHDEEEQVRSTWRQRLTGEAPPIDDGEPVPAMEPGKDAAAVRAERVRRYGEAAASRLDEVDARWADWDRRLADARQHWQRLQADAGLSAPQRVQAMDEFVATHFTGKEPVRVQALLQYRPFP